MSSDPEYWQLEGYFKGRRAQFECDSYGDELIAVNSARLYKLIIYGRMEDESNGTIIYKEVQSIDLPHNASLIKFLSREYILADQQIYHIGTGKPYYSVPMTPYTLEDLPMAFSEKKGLFARASNACVTILCNLPERKQMLKSPQISPNTFTKVGETLIFHGIYHFGGDRLDDTSYVELHVRRGQTSHQLPFVIESHELIEQNEGMLIGVTQDKYALISAQDERADRETFKVIDMNTKTVLWQYTIEPRKVRWRHGELRYMTMSGALFVPQSDHVIVHIPGGGYILFDWKENRPIITLEYGTFGLPIKLSHGGRYYVMTTRVSGTHTLIYNRIEKSLLLLGTYSDRETVDFHPSNEHQIAIAECGVKIFDLKNKVQIKELTRFVDGQVQVLRECEGIAVVKYSPSGRYLAVIEPPSRKPWGLSIAPSILRVYETKKWTMITSLDLGDAAQALHWLDEEHALIGSTDGKIVQLKIVVPEFAQLFKYIIPPDQGRETEIRDVTNWFMNENPFDIDG